MVSNDRTLCIAIVDDEPDDRALIERELRGDGEFGPLEILHVKDEAGLESLLQECAADVVITDFRLRWADGLEVLRKVKAGNADIPVIMYTATGNEEVAVDAMKLGLDDYILKSPRHVRRLPSAVRAALERRESRRRLLESETRFRRLFESVPIGLYRTTLGGEFLALNPAGADILGYGRDEAAKALSHSFLPSDKKRFVQALKRNGMVRDLHVMCTRKDGSLAWLSVSGTLVKHSEIHEPVVEGAFIDVTDRMEADARLRMAMEGAIGALATAVEKRDPYTAGHQHRVAELARAVAVGMGLDEDAAHGVYIGGLLHDIGKISVPAEILTKPGRLTEAEYELIRQHPRIGYEIVKDVAFPWPIADMVLHHHERMNGSGYPDGISNGKIGVGARILAVADVVEAMSSHRPYRPALGMDKAIEEIRKNRGILYDEDVVDACIEQLDHGVIGTAPSIDSRPR